ncbi:hypothetical protein QE424_000179 [Stenotrophomonas rhizophila]|jgi:hypothetical protein|uniref:Uncharacterized protein n=1 Tax=Stenotrophomonas rhizophila TaxID=216778 RepID=A0AAP5AGG2_9GAMM|nr:hypothetical protein [Stenotrophomonas rhizophila]MDQ1107020.1 hypothetical protein [Stenotrophomonas rhizophila]
MLCTEDKHAESVEFLANDVHGTSLDERMLPLLCASFRFMRSASAARNAFSMHIPIEIASVN